MTYSGIFIVGCPRSGTTLLQSLIGCSPALATFKETRLFTSTIALRGGRFLPVRSVRSEIARFGKENDLSLASSLARPIFALSPQRRARRLLQVLDNAAKERSRPVWLEKTPRHLRYIPLIQAASRADDRKVAFIHIVRDGVPNAASLAKASKNWQTAYTASSALTRWQEDVATTRSYLGKEGHYFVCYEDIVADPNGQTLRLAGRLGLPLSEQDLENRSALAASVIRPDETWKALNTGAIKPTGNTSDHLPETVLADLEDRIDRSDYNAIRAAIV